MTETAKTKGTPRTVVLKKTGVFVTSHQNASASPASMPARTEKADTKNRG